MTNPDSSQSEEPSKSPDDIKRILVLDELTKLRQDDEPSAIRVCLNYEEEKDIKIMQKKLDFLKKGKKHSKEFRDPSAETEQIKKLTKDNDKCTFFLQQIPKWDWEYKTETEDDLKKFNNMFDVKSPEFYMEQHRSTHLDDTVLNPNPMSEDEIKKCTKMAKDYTIRGPFNIAQNKDLSASEIMENKKKMIQKFKTWGGRIKYYKLITDYFYAFKNIMLAEEHYQKGVDLSTSNRIEIWKKKRFDTNEIIILTESERKKYELPLDLDIPKLHKSLFEDKLYLDCGNIEDIGWEDGTSCFNEKSIYDRRAPLEEYTYQMDKLKKRVERTKKKEEDEDLLVSSGKATFLQKMRIKLKRYLDVDENGLNTWFWGVTTLVVVILLVILYFVYIKKK